MRLLPSVTPWAAALSLTLFGCANEPSPVATYPQPITDGVVHTGHPAVGQLRGGPGFCTATLIGTRTVLTAAHCVTPGNEHTFTTDDGTVYRSLDVHRHPSFDPDPDVLSSNDVALVVLGGAPPITPAVISNSAPAVDMALTLVGFGTTGNEDGKLGIKRIATNQIDDFTSTRFRFSGTGGGEGGTCVGDSGGPAFIIDNDVEVLLGVTSSADSSQCGNFTWDARVDIHQTWISDNMDRVSSTPQVSITAPLDGATVQSPLTVSIDVTHDQSITAVECWVGTQLQQTVNAAPYACSLDLSPGEQVVRVVARDALQQRGESQISVTVAGATDAGAADGGVSADSAPQADGGDSTDGQGGCSAAPGPASPGWILALMLAMACGRLTWDRKPAPPSAGG